jgi:hypothetical protein
MWTLVANCVLVLAPLLPRKQKITNTNLTVPVKENVVK